MLRILLRSFQIVSSFITDYILPYFLFIVYIIFENSITAKSIPTPRGKTKWPVSTVKSILTNEKYKGDAVLQKTYTVDYLTKEKRKNDGEVKKYFVENSHEPIISPEVFDKVQELLEQRYKKRNWSGSNRPFANRIVCGECGQFYGHKVWHNRHNTERYHVWYCNHRYDGCSTCKTPILREREIRQAFEAVLKKLKTPDPTYSDERWRTLVECVTVFPDRRLSFKLTEGKEIEIRIK